MRGSELESLGTGPPSRGSSTAACYHYGNLEGLHTGSMVFHVSRLSVSVRPNLAMFYSRWGLSGSVFMFGIIDARLMINTFSAWYS